MRKKPLAAKIEAFLPVIGKARDHPWINSEEDEFLARAEAELAIYAEQLRGLPGKPFLTPKGRAVVRKWTIAALEDAQAFIKNHGFNKKVRHG